MYAQCDHDLDPLVSFSTFVRYPFTLSIHTFLLMLSGEHFDILGGMPHESQGTGSTNSEFVLSFED